MIKVLQEMHHYHNKQYGLRWSDITSYIEQYALGRKLTKVDCSGSSKKTSSALTGSAVEKETCRAGCIIYIRLV